MISITSWVAFQVAESAPQGPLQRPHPQPLGHLPDAVTEESQASEKSEASPSSTVRENRDGPVSFEDARTDRRGRAETRGEKSFAGRLIIPTDRARGDSLQGVRWFRRDVKQSECERTVRTSSAPCPWQV